MLDEIKQLKEDLKKSREEMKQQLQDHRSNAQQNNDNKEKEINQYTQQILKEFQQLKQAIQTQKEQSSKYNTDKIFEEKPLIMKQTSDFIIPESPKQSMISQTKPLVMMSPQINHAFASSHHNHHHIGRHNKPPKLPTKSNIPRYKIYVLVYV